MGCKAALAVIGLLVVTGTSIQAQTPVPEMTTRDQAFTFKAVTNLVLVPVVVRDARGHTIANLVQGDFQLFDRGKPQVIARFSTVTSQGRGAASGASPVSEEAAGPDVSIPSTALPERFVGYLFDDLNLGVEDMLRVREAATRHMRSALRPQDRAAIFTTSGVGALDFTGDPDQLLQGVMRLQPRLSMTSLQRHCPELNYYWANLIRTDPSDPDPREYAKTEAYGCLQLQPSSMNDQIAWGAVLESVAAVLALGEQNSRSCLSALDNAIRRVSLAPGQRIVVMVSSGFLTSDLKQEESVIIDRAIRSGVTVNALDGRGLYADGPDPGKPSIVAAPGASRSTSRLIAWREMTEHQTSVLRQDVMAEAADGTGGTFVRNSNDLEQGLRELAVPPEYSYILGFSPQNLKLDGGFHALRVTVKGPAGITVEARHGYSAPKSLSDPAEMAREEIRQALFSREEISDFPADLHSEFFKRGPDTARLSIVVHVGLGPLHFKKAENRNHDNLSVTVGLFDRNGNYVSGVGRDVELRLKEEMFERWMHNGITVPCTLDVKPGTYLLRLVVREAEGALMAARNGVVEIP